MIVACAIHKSNKALLEQQKKTSFDMLEQQKIINSAKLTLHLYEYWTDEKYRWFREFLRTMHESKIKENNHAIHPSLTIFETIAIFWHEGTLTDNHVKEFFGNSLRDIRDNEIMQDYIEKESKSEPNFILVNLRTLLQETVKWNI